MKTLTLKFKLVVTGVLIALIPLSVVGLFSIVQSSQAIRELAENRSLMAAQNCATLANNFVEEEIKLARSMATSHIVGGAIQGAVLGQKDAITTLDRYLSSEFQNGQRI